MPSSARASATIRPRPQQRKGTMKKKRCELGPECPYKDEFQHQMEFSHDYDQPRKAKRSLNSTFQPFAGAGHTMPGPSIKGNRSSADAALRRSVSAPSTATINLCDEIETITEESSSRRLGRKKSDSATVAKRVRLDSVINLCDEDDSDDEQPKVKQKVDFVSPVPSKRRLVDPCVLSPSWKVAISEDEERRQMAQAVAASNRDVISEQDAEYYHSLMNDQAKERARRDEQERSREEEDLRIAIEESARLAEEESKLSASQNILDHLQTLEPEPPEGKPSATIAFRLPSQCSTPRLIRRFPLVACADQLISYLKSREELVTIPKWSLRTVVGGVYILPTTSLLDLGLAPRGVVVVRNEED